MSKQRAWLLGEIDRWRQGDIITDEQAQKIKALYPTAPSAPLGLILFSSFGAAIVGLGIILLIAHNWQAIPRPGKVAMVVGATALAHGVGLFLRERGDWKARLSEAIFLLGTMLFGAGIWLVAQAYNIDEHYPNGFLIWGLGALGLAWALRSTPQAIAAIVLVTVWGSCEVLNFGQPQAWAIAILLLALPLLYAQRSALLVGFWLTAIYTLLFANAAAYGGTALGFTAQLSLSVLLIAVARELRHGHVFPQAAGVTLFFGYTGFFFSVNLLSFKSLVHDLFYWRGSEESSTAFHIYGWALFACALLAWLALLRKERRTHPHISNFEEWLCPIALIYAQVIAGHDLSGDDVFTSGVFKIVFAAMAVMWMLRGCQSGSLRKTVVGSLLFCVWIFARYFDLFDSLVSRGVAFLFLGAALFVEAFFYRKLRQDGMKGQL